MHSEAYLNKNIQQHNKINNNNVVHLRYLIQ
jgi:hypothetical protein